MRFTQGTSGPPTTVNFRDTNGATRLVNELPELVARQTGHAVRCECERCRAELARVLAVAQRDIDAGLDNNAN